MSTVNRTSSNSYQNPGFEEDTDISKTSGTALRNRNLERSNSLPHDEHETNIDIDSEPHGSQPESEENKNLGCKGKLARKYDMVLQFCRKHKTTIQYIIYGILITAYLAVVIAACILNFHRALALFILTLLAIFFICWDFFIARYENKIAELLSPLGTFLKAQWFWLKWVVWVILIVAVLCWLIFDTAKQGTNQLISFGGLLMYILLMLIFSKYPTKVVWRPVIWGVAMQFVLGLITLRTKVGFDAFNWLGNQVQIFLGYTDAGAKFVFGEKYTDHFFAFKVLPIIIFFSTVMSVLYYVGFMQWLIKKVGWIMQITLQTSPVESLVAAGNIFVGMSESPLMVKPYLPYVTKSELHAIMTAGFATIAGSVLGAYISFGVVFSLLRVSSVAIEFAPVVYDFQSFSRLLSLVKIPLSRTKFCLSFKVLLASIFTWTYIEVSASHLLTASVMSAPAALAIAKLFWPETENPQINAQEDTKMEKGEARNLLEAASQGASAAIPLVANIAVNLIAFLALLAFFNAVLSWLGNMFDYPQLSFEIICSYLFMPLSFMMGVDWEDSFIVGRLLGYKTFFNEFVAYEHLANFIKLRKEGRQMYVNGMKQYLSIRSETIATYALCGFANFGSVGMVLGALSSLAPSRKRDIAGGAFRAMIAGTVACFMTACVAGILSENPCTTLLQGDFSVNDNSTEIVACCLNLFNSGNSSAEIFPKSNSSLRSLHQCCQLLGPSKVNCSSVAPLS